jgi:hypothetical protein
LVPLKVTDARVLRKAGYSPAGPMHPRIIFAQGGAEVIPIPEDLFPKE